MSRAEIEEHEDWYNALLCPVYCHQARSRAYDLCITNTIVVLQQVPKVSGSLSAQKTGYSGLEESQTTAVHSHASGTLSHELQSFRSEFISLVTHNSAAFRKSITSSLVHRRHPLPSLRPTATLMQQQRLQKKSASACASRSEYGDSSVKKKQR